MGYIRSHAILVTDHGYGDDLEKAHAFAVGLGACVTPITDAVTNGVRSFALMPDGSKEGWPESDEGDGRRAAFVAHLRSYQYEDGSSPLSWVEVQYGDDNNEARILGSSDDDFKARA